MITNEKELAKTIRNAKQSKAQYRESIQEAIVYFVNEWNGSLQFNTNYFKDIVETVGKDVKDLRAWLFKYTNIQSVKSDLLHITTNDYEFVKDSKGNDKKVYILKFNDDYNGQKWYESADKTDKEALKELTGEMLQKSAILMYKKYTKDGNAYDDKGEKLLKAIKEIYQL